MTEFEQTKILAEQGDAEAQDNLGYMYYDGNGVAQDKSEAVRWFTKAAEQGHAKAQYNMGVMYEYGFGVKQDYAEAVRWYTKADEQGHAYARKWRDVLTKKWRVKMTEFEQTKLLAEQGDVRAQFNLGLMYANGRGVEKDYAEAVRWWTKAAEQGHAEAQYSVDKLTKKMERKND